VGRVVVLVKGVGLGAGLGLVLAAEDTLLLVVEDVGLDAVVAAAAVRVVVFAVLTNVFLTGLTGSSFLAAVTGFLIGLAVDEAVEDLAEAADEAAEDVAAVGLVPNFVSPVLFKGVAEGLVVVVPEVGLLIVVLVGLGVAFGLAVVVVVVVVAVVLEAAVLVVVVRVVVRDDAVVGLVRGFLVTVEEVGFFAVVAAAAGCGVLPAKAFLATSVLLVGVVVVVLLPGAAFFLWFLFRSSRLLFLFNRCFLFKGFKTCLYRS
jgi:hypothetical protein